MPGKSTFRWEEQAPNQFFAYSGGEIIGHVLRRSTDGRWVWGITDVVGSKHRRATQGTCKAEADAKSAFRRAWLHWLAERGLREID